MNPDNTESQRLNKIIAEIQALQEVVTRFRQMRLDATEFACLKCIVTFKAGESSSVCAQGNDVNNFPSGCAIYASMVMMRVLKRSSLDDFSSH